MGMLLKPWRLSGLLTPTRTVGQILLRKNGTMLDIWIRVKGKPERISVSRFDLKDFLPGDVDRWSAENDKELLLLAESDGNAEEVSV
jgi:hypothetical protein